MVVALVSSMVECDFCEEALVDLNNLYKDVNKINVIKHQGDEEKKKQCGIGVLEEFKAWPASLPKG